MENHSSFDQQNKSPSGSAKRSRLSAVSFGWILATAIAANLLFGGVNSVALGLISVMTAFTVVFWIADSLFSKRLRYSTSYLQIPLIVLIVIGLIQLLPFANHGIPAELFSGSVSSTFSFDAFATRLAVLKLVLFLIFFSAALVFLDSPKRLRITVFVLIVFAAVMSFIGILQKLSNPDVLLWLKQVDYAQPFASYVNQHHFAAFLEMTIALTLGLLFAGSTKPDKRLLLIIAVVMMGFGIVFTTSRGALFSLVAILTLLSVLSFWPRKKRSEKNKSKKNLSKVWVLVGSNIALIIFLLVSVAWLGGGDIALRSAGLSTQEDFSNGRFQFWSTTFEIIKDNPVLGSGLDTFQIAYTKYDKWNGQIRVNHAHNEYIHMLSEAGIFGLLSVFAFIGLLFRKSLKIIGSTHHPYRRGIAAGALAGCFGILIHSFFDFPLRTNANMFFFLICAVLATTDVEFPAVVRRVRKKKVPKVVKVAIDEEGM